MCRHRRLGYTVCMRRVTQLDGVRGVAISLVLVWHYFSCQAAYTSWVFKLFVRGSGQFWSGVDLFFVLSGFLIAGILLDHRNSSNYFRVFYVRRACRIFPLYFLLLGSFACFRVTSMPPSPGFDWLFNHPMPLWSYATFTQNIFMGIRREFGANWLGITWSLAVEEQFYLLVPLLIYFFPRRIVLACCLVAAFAAPLLRWASPGFHAFVNTPWRADSLLSGASLAIFVRWRPFLSAVQARRRLVLAIFFASLVGAGLLTWKPGVFGPFNHLWLAGLYFVFILIAFAGIEPNLHRLLGSSLLVWLGNRSYGIYMFHQAVSGILYGYLRNGPPQMRTLGDAGITLASLLLTLLLAMISYRFLEVPILQYGHRLRYS